MNINRRFLEAFMLAGSALLFASQSAWAQLQHDQWTVGRANSAGEAARQCSDAACLLMGKGDSAQLIKVCMYRDPVTKGFFSKGAWLAHIGENAPQPCAEVFYANLQRKALFLTRQFPSDVSHGAIYCPPGPPRQPGLEACLSDFMTQRESQSSYKVLDVLAVSQAMEQAKVLEAIDRHVSVLAEQKLSKERQVYLSEFEGAKGSLHAMKQFEDKYRSADPEGLILKLDEFRRPLRLEEYNQRLAKMATTSDIEQFIAAYEGDDLGGKLVQARQQLAQVRQRDADVAKGEAFKKAAAERAERLGVLERGIIWCKRESAAARQVIERENEIGRISGFVNTKRLHDAGKAIVYCDRNAPDEFTEYKQLGGKRSYSELR